jgi:hypothetical protein
MVALRVVCDPASLLSSRACDRKPPIPALPCECRDFTQKKGPRIAGLSEDRNVSVLNLYRHCGMSDGDLQPHEQRLKQATRKLRLAARRLEIAKTERNQAIRASKDALPRRRAAELTEMTPGRIQQIIDRTR